jgi:hypothetical protein
LCQQQRQSYALLSDVDINGALPPRRIRVNVEQLYFQCRASKQCGNVQANVGMPRRRGRAHYQHVSTTEQNGWSPGSRFVIP